MEPVQTTDVFTALVNLIPVFGGAVIGVVGGLVGTAYANRLSQANSMKSELRTKLEMLVTEVYELNVWLKKQEKHCLFGEEETLEHSPMSKIEALTAMYFQELDSQVLVLTKAELHYRQWLIEGAKQRIAAGTSTPPQVHLDKIHDFYGPIASARKQLVNAARDIMNEL